ncbi:MAG: META domain-containing protein [Mangrovimonas sp.]|nr:META domain-containing protein [Mangrovimonas sp.]MCB0426300.1 META domain-containing protein [Mangrovimonas sp.]MCB0437802.1 META domain-containing protein [Mangrovimonas sp.]
MKTAVALSLVLLLFTSCTTSKSEEALYGSTWELEYLSGPRIAFEGLFANKKPQLEFNKEESKAIGNSGCNGYSAQFKVDGNTISFGEPGPSTLMYCGEGETFFRNTIKKVNRFKIDENGKLNLMLDDVPMMRFKKIQ